MSLGEGKERASAMGSDKEEKKKEKGTVKDAIVAVLVYSGIIGLITLGIKLLGGKKDPKIIKKG